MKILASLLMVLGYYPIVKLKENGHWQSYGIGEAELANWLKKKECHLQNWALSHLNKLFNRLPMKHTNNGIYQK